jgi:hypothetical protein
MYISLLACDAKSDELDLLIDEKSPMPAESVPVGEGIYIRRELSSGRVVGAFIRGYSHLLKKLHRGAGVRRRREASRSSRGFSGCFSMGWRPASAKSSFQIG